MDEQLFRRILSLTAFIGRRMSAKDQGKLKDITMRKWKIKPLMKEIPQQSTDGICIIDHCDRHFDQIVTDEERENKRIV